MKESFLLRAKENLESAELLYNNEKYNASANRAYYAAFHGAIAAIYSIGIEPNIGHKTVQTMFADNFFNRRKIISSKYKGDLKELQEKRNIADYHEGVSKNAAKNNYYKQKIN